MTKRIMRRGTSKFPIVVDVANHQRRWPIQALRLRLAVKSVLGGEGIKRANVSLAIVSDRAIRAINRKFLNHDESTDVISFAFEREDGFVDGELVISADTAAKMAADFGWARDDEILLYAIHGALHLAGYVDRKPADRRAMRAKEKFYLKDAGLKPQYRSSRGNKAK